MAASLSGVASILRSIGGRLAGGQQSAPRRRSRGRWRRAGRRRRARRCGSGPAGAGGWARCRAAGCRNTPRPRAPLCGARSRVSGSESDSGRASGALSQASSYWNSIGAARRAGARAPTRHAVRPHGELARLPRAAWVTTRPWVCCRARSPSAISRPSTLSSASNCSTVRVSGRASSSDKRFCESPSRFATSVCESSSALRRPRAWRRSAWRGLWVAWRVSVIAITAIYRQYR